jgi:hypothetical protein
MENVLEVKGKTQNERHADIINRLKLQALPQGVNEVLPLLRVGQELWESIEIHKRHYVAKTKLLAM